MANADTNELRAEAVDRVARAIYAKANEKILPSEKIDALWSSQHKPHWEALARAAMSAADFVNAACASPSPVLTGEPAAWRYSRFKQDWTLTTVLSEHDIEILRSSGVTVEPLYASPPQPVSGEKKRGNGETEGEKTAWLKGYAEGRKDEKTDSAERKEAEEDRPLVNQLTGALRFILAFYEPGQKHLDTNAWTRAEASGRAALAAGEAAIALRKGEQK